MILSKVFPAQNIIVNLESDDKDEVFEEMVQNIVDSNASLDREKVLSALEERESLMTTGILHGVAVPHGKLDSVNGIYGCIGLSKKGIDYDSLDKAPVHIVFMLLYSPDYTESNLEIFRRLATMLENPMFAEDLLSQKTSQAAYDVLCSYEEKILLG